jgi:hypothetical protein
VPNGIRLDLRAGTAKLWKNESWEGRVDRQLDVMDVWASSDEFVVSKTLDPGHRPGSSTFFTLKFEDTLQY